MGYNIDLNIKVHYLKLEHKKSKKKLTTDT